MNVILQSVYAGNVNYYAAILKSENVIVDINEHFLKQSYRNRCVIAGANGPLNLIVPVQRRGVRKALKDVKIDNSQRWQKLHWKSLESAYRTSPYFEYFEHKFFPIYNDQQHDFLFELNVLVHRVIMDCLNEDLAISYSKNYVDDWKSSFDLRNQVHPKKQPSVLFSNPLYTQVFQDRMKHISNCSVLDILFNEGPRALSLLKQ